MAQVKDARAALEALREEERERKRREAEEAEKLRQRSSSSHVFTIPEFMNLFFSDYDDFSGLDSRPSSQRSSSSHVFTIPESKNLQFFFRIFFSTRDHA